MSVTPIRSANPYHHNLPLSWQSDASERIAGHDLAIETALAEISRLELRICELEGDGMEEVGQDGKLTELAYSHMELPGFEHSLDWNLKETRSRRKDLGIEPHIFDRLPMAAE